MEMTGVYRMLPHFMALMAIVETSEMPRISLVLS